MTRAVLIVLLALESATVFGAQVGVDEHPDAQVPLDVNVVDEGGRHVRVRDLLDPSAPTLLVLSYFRCPVLCDQIVGSLGQTAPEARTTGGVDYRVLVVSFDPRDTATDAAAKAQSLAGRMSAFERSRWRFAVSDGGSGARIAAAVGFRYEYDASVGEYAHPAVAIVLTPAGHVATYLYGVSFPSDVLVPALRAAGGGQTVSPLQRVLITCFHYVPSVRRHAAAVAWVLRGGTLLLFAALTAALVVLVRRQQRPRREVSRA